MAQRKAKWQNDYIAKTYDRVTVLVAKGDKERIRGHAEERGESINAFVNRAIESQIRRDKELEH
jgi:predicted HicB family RNase H-like nuclease